MSLPRVIGLLCCVAALGACQQSAWVRGRQVERLRRAFPVFEALRVEAFRDQDWCRNTSYRRGRYSTNNEQSTCNLFAGPAEALTGRAAEDFAAVGRTLRESGVGAIFMSAGYGADGKIKRAEFNLDCFFCSRPRYVYEPGYGTPPPDEEGEMWFTAIDEDWYLAEEDWN